MPAEWEPTGAVLVAWPHPDTDWNHMLDDIRATYGNLITELSKITHVIVAGPEAPSPDYFGADACKENIEWFETDTNDTWTRDYGPIGVENPDGSFSAVDFRFDGWGLKFAANLDNGVNRRLSEGGIIAAPLINKLSFTLEGGSIETDGKGLLLTTSECLLSPNRNGAATRDDIEHFLRDTLGFTTILWLDHGALEGDDTDSHIDTLARLLPPGDTIAYTGCHDPSDSNYEALTAMTEQLKTLRRPDGKPFNLVELPQPEAVYDPDDGIRLPATYANFLIVNHTVLMPVYNQPLQDTTALMTMAAVMPDYHIVPVDCSALIRQHGSLHCATMQLHPALLKKH